MDYISLLSLMITMRIQTIKLGLYCLKKSQKVGLRFISVSKEKFLAILKNTLKKDTKVQIVLLYYL